MFSSITGITVKDMAGNDINLSEYNGKVLIIVNVASKCGYTPQYADLQKVYSEYKDKGLEILAFPCNDFGGQEPGTNSEIQEFCTSNYGVTFKLFDKIKVLGEEKSPLYERLTNSEAVEKGDIKWNFEKFIISKDGNIIERFRSKVKPTSEEFLAVVKSELAK
ncbi:MAG: glutathione peroxidase [Melioribacteraceae bacterium]|nr:glutathione peroxidase [Melioribacteraceae bacterium]MCF8353119.1 glutathione peroxidase [Melioribacteraceae bacterium]MCF8392735.1 glutathione peroxidase [Melioribacteraceae bacterium]MCF8418266.1 glutathione peroxidase [Melioribacteraceae bacterium]